jgi:hypothetical protein
MYGRNILKGIPKCNTCIYFRPTETKNEIGNCIKYLGSHNKPISVEIARYNYMMCGYYGTQHKSVIDTVLQPHI